MVAEKNCLQCDQMWVPMFVCFLVSMTAYGAVSVSSGRATEIDREMLSVKVVSATEFDFSQLPKSIRDLEGRPVRIRGYIVPPYAEGNYSKFQIVTENNSEQRVSSSSMSPSLTNILIDVETVHPLEFKGPFAEGFLQNPQPVAIEGTMRIRSAVQGKYSVTIFSIEGARVQPTPHLDGREPTISLGALLFGC